MVRTDWGRRGLWPSVFAVCDQTERTVHCLFRVSTSTYSREG
jgi:hypothetical protein